MKERKKKRKTILGPHGNGNDFNYSWPSCQKICKLMCNVTLGCILLEVKTYCKVMNTESNQWRCCFTSNGFLNK